MRAEQVDLGALAWLAILRPRGLAAAMVGLGSDQFGSEFSVTGEELDERRRARMLDESLEHLDGRLVG